MQELGQENKLSYGFHWKGGQIRKDGYTMVGYMGIGVR